MLQIALVFQTYSDQCTSLIRDRNISVHTERVEGKLVTVVWTEFYTESCAMLEPWTRFSICDTCNTGDALH